MYSGAKYIGPILKELFPSEEMAAYLARCPFSRNDRLSSHSRTCRDTPPEKLPLRRYEIENIITGAPVSLERKREMFLLLAEGEKDGYFSALADAASRAVQEMKPKQGEFFYLKSYCFDNGDFSPKERALEPYLSWEHIFARIRQFLDDKESGENSLTWFVAEKWSPDGAGKLVNNYDYTIAGPDVCYCWCNAPSHREQTVLESYGDLNVPVPFHAGDIVTIDCRPFAPVHHVAILEVGDNRDCCCLQALYRKGDGIWNTGAVKHGYIFQDRLSPCLSPLYRLASFHGELPKEESILKKVSLYLHGDEDRGTAMWNYISSLSDRRDRKSGISEAQLLSYMGSNMESKNVKDGAEGNVAAKRSNFCRRAVRRKIQR